MMFVGNLGYVVVAVIGGILVTRRAIAIGDVQAFIQYSRQFSMPITQLSSIANTIQLTIASAERVFELLDEPEEPADAGRRRRSSPRRAATSQFDHVSFSYKADAPLIEDMNIDVAAGPDDRHRRPHRRRQDDAGQPADALLRRQRRRDSRRRHRHPRDDARRPAPHVRHGAAGHLAVLRHDPRQHRLRPRGRHRRGDRAARPRRRRPTTSSARCRRATTRSSTRKRPTSRRARSSC